MFTSPGAIAFKLGGLSVHWYGLILGLAFIIGLFLVRKIAKEQDENPDIIFDLAIYILIGALIGARLYYVIFNWSFYSYYPYEIIKTWHGGISIHGALIGGFLTGSIYVLKNKLPLLKYADLYSYGLILGQAIGRWGNFFNSEAFGLPTDLPWKLYIPMEARPEKYIDYEYFHPTFLYEFFWDLIVFYILFFVLRKKIKNYNGMIFFSYLILYSVGRFVIDGFRVDDIYAVLGLHLAQFASVALIVIGVLGILFVKLYSNKARQD